MGKRVGLQEIEGMARPIPRETLSLMSACEGYIKHGKGCVAVESSVIQNHCASNPVERDLASETLAWAQLQRGSINSQELGW